MSLHAMLWALKQAPVENAQEQMILMAMADFAREDGTRCYLAQATIAERSTCSVRTLQRHLQELERRGLIFRGDQQMVAHFPANHRPIVWTLNVSLTRGDNLTPQNRGDKLTGATNQDVRGDKPGSSGASPVSHNPKTNPTNNPDRFPSADISLADRRSAIDSCDLCDVHGYDDRKRVCDHDPDAMEVNSRGMGRVREVLAKRVGPPGDDGSR